MNPTLPAQNSEENRTKNPLLGLVADEPGLMDVVLEAAMKDRESQPLRLPSEVRSSRVTPPTTPASPGSATP